MINIGVHEYIRSLLPALVFAVLVSIIWPQLVLQSTSSIVGATIAIGLVFSPITERFALWAFHKEVSKLRFYETFFGEFEKFCTLSNADAEISLKNSIRDRAEVFSGKLKLSLCRNKELMLDAYKILSIRGWNGAEEAYRVRTEKSFGIMYFTLACYSLVAASLVCINIFIYKFGFPDHIEPVYVFIGCIIVSLVCIFESRSRFRKSLGYELIALRGHYSELEEYLKILERLHR